MDIYRITVHSEARLSMCSRQARALLPDTPCPTYGVTAPQPRPSSTITAFAVWNRNLLVHSQCSWQWNSDKMMDKKYYFYIRLQIFILLGISKIISTPLFFKTDQPGRKGNKLSTSLSLLWTSIQLRA